MQNVSKSFQHVPRSTLSSKEVSVDDSSEAYVSSYNSDTEDHTEETRYLIGNYQETAQLIDIETPVVVPITNDLTEHKSLLFQQNSKTIKIENLGFSEMSSGSKSSQVKRETSQSFCVKSTESENEKLTVSQRMVSTQSARVFTDIFG